jgi:SNF family Na+-dependent transporter
MLSSHPAFSCALTDAKLITMINCATSIFGGLIVFSVLGFVSQQTGVPIDEMDIQGAGLPFIVFPTAVANMPGAPFWAVCFFAMLLCLGVRHL